MDAIAIASSSYFCHRSAQRSGSRTFAAAVTHQRLVIAITHYKAHTRDDVVENQITIHETVYIAGDFSHIKKFSSDASIRAVYTHKISGALSRVRVPQPEHEEIIESVFLAVDRAVSVDPHIEVAVWDITETRSRDFRPNHIAAAQSSIQCLEQLQLSESDVQQAVLHTPSCPICFQDFDFAAAQEEEGQNRITCLPCAHHYHLHCILQWLQRSHLCPMCRHPMPTDGDTQQGIKGAGFCRSDDFYLDKLHNILQTSTVHAYQMQFEMLRSLVVARHSHLDKAYFLSCCINGPNEEMRSTVQSFWPSSVDAVFSIARLKEYLLSYEVRHSSTVGSTNSTSSSSDTSADMVLPISDEKDMPISCEQLQIPCALHENQLVDDNFVVDIVVNDTIRVGEQVQGFMELPVQYGLNAFAAVYCIPVIVHSVIVHKLVIASG